MRTASGYLLCENVKFAVAHCVSSKRPQPACACDSLKFRLMVRAGSKKHVVTVEGPHRIDHVQTSQGMRHMNKAARVRRENLAIQSTGCCDRKTAAQPRRSGQTQANTHLEPHLTVKGEYMLRTMAAVAAHDHLNLQAFGMTAQGRGPNPHLIHRG